MASFNLRKFADPDRLRGIAPARLRSFMSPWQTYLSARGFEFPDTGQAEIDYATLADILMRPNAATPADMVDALYYVHETATDQDMENLLATIRERGLSVTNDPSATPIDLAMDVWAVEPDVVRAHHAEAIAMRQQNFEYFGPIQPRRGPFPSIDDEMRQRLEREFDDWFESHRRGRGCRLFVIRHSPMTWILVRHGQTMRREASQKDDGGVGTEFYRPQRHDVLIYDERSGDIGVNASTKGERNLYLQTFGRHLFANEDHFPPAGRFTLDPLMTAGSDALNSDDIDGIQAIRLVEYRRYWGGAYKEIENRKAEDVFGALALRGHTTLVGGRLVSATFKVMFDDSDKERSVTIRPPGVARYDRNDDSELIEHWLRERGFILNGQGTDDDEAATAVLESA